jgi:hypothetical protein
VVGIGGIQGFFPILGGVHAENNKEDESIWGQDEEQGNRDHNACHNGLLISRDSLTVQLQDGHNLTKEMRNFCGTRDGWSNV